MTPLALGSIRQIAITVADLDRAVRFYRDTLGLPFLFQAQNMAFFDCSGIRLMLGLPEANPGTFRSILYHKVDHIAAAAEALRARGVVFERDPHLVAHMPDHDLWMAFFRDPDRNLLGLMSEVPRGSRTTA